MNIGTEQNYRIPDASLHRPGTPGVYVPTAALPFEILSRGDETLGKLPLYASCSVSEVAIVNPEAGTVDWRALADNGEYRSVERSAVIELGAVELAGRLGLATTG